MTHPRLHTGLAGMVCIFILALPLWPQTPPGTGQAGSADSTGSTAPTSPKAPVTPTPLDSDPLLAEPLVLGYSNALKLLDRNNIDLASARIELEALLRDYQNRYNSWYPDLGLSMGFTMADGLFSNAGASGSNDPTSLSLRLSLGLPVGSTSDLDAKLREQAWTDGQLTFQLRRLALHRDTAKLWLALLKAQADLELRNETLKLARQSLDRVERSYTGGAASESEVLKARLAASSAAAGEFEARSNLEKLERSLKRLLGLPASKAVSFTGSLESGILPVDPRALEDRDPDATLSQLQGRLAVETAQTELEKAQRAQLPQFSSSLAWSSGIDSIFQADSWSDIGDRLTLSLGLSLPMDSWLPGSKEDLAIKRLADRLQSRSLALEKAREDLHHSLEDLRADMTTLETTLALNRSSIDLASRSLNLIRLSWEAGRIGIEDLQAAELALSNAKNTFLSNQYRYQVLRCDLAWLLSFP